MKIRIEDEKGVEEFENAVALTGCGWYNAGLVIICGGCIMSVLIESLCMAYILPAAQCDLDLTLSEKSILSSISFLGVCLSSLLWGFIGDTVGRKKVIVVTLFLTSLCGILSSFVPYVWLFIVLRFLNGFFVGCPCSVVVAYIGEFHSEDLRAKVITWVGTFVAAASFYLPGLAWFILTMEWSFWIPGLGILMRPWRLLVIVFSFPSFLFACCLLRFPESPKFLWSVGKTDEALEILRNMYSVNTKNPGTLYPVTKFMWAPTPIIELELDKNSKSILSMTHALIKQIWVQIAPLFCMPLLPHTAIIALLQFGMQACSNGVFMWVPDIINHISKFMVDNPTQPVMICSSMDYNPFLNKTDIFDSQREIIKDCVDVVDVDVFKITLILGAVYTIVYLCLGFIINIFGKKLLLVAILLLTGVAGIFLHTAESYNIIMVTMGIYLMGGPGVNIVLTIIVDLFPTQYRAMAVATTQMIGRIGAVMGSYSMGFLIKMYCPYTFYTFAAACMGLIVLAMFLPLPLFPSWKSK